jgi:CheY-like chemotaxis protein
MADAPHILLVDDDPDIRRILDLLLTHGGYRVTEAGDGEEALATMEAESFDAVVLDVAMPKMDGITFCTTIRADPRFTLLPVLIFTGQPNHPGIERATSLPAVRQMSKGDPSRVIGALREMIASPEQASAPQQG